ncbi:DNA-binding protein [Bacillus sp. AR2-1]|nr:DNA-binding protein [Bacillus sp. AR2-1]
MFDLGTKHIGVTILKKENCTFRPICEAYNFCYIVVLEFNEYISDFKKVIKDCSRPANIYENSPCNGGKKY